MGFQLYFSRRTTNGDFVMPYQSIHDEIGYLVMGYMLKLDGISGMRVALDLLQEGTLPRDNKGVALACALTESYQDNGRWDQGETTDRFVITCILSAVFNDKIAQAIMSRGLIDQLSWG